MSNANEVLSFWFQELKPAQWFKKDPALDEQIRMRFLTTHGKASRCELSHWRDSIEGRLAEVIVLDQFSRNLFRGDPRSFFQDTMALTLSQEAIRTGQHLLLTVLQRAFLYMPFMHSESPMMHEKAVDLFAEKGMEGNLEFELLHKQIIDRFGRFPHRNQILGRASTAEEIEFLKQPGSGF